MNVLIKGSGDVLGKKEFINFINRKSEHNNVVVICGAGTKINEALKNAGFKINFDKYGRRITKSNDKLLAKVILQNEKLILQSKCPRALALMSLLEIGNVTCPINGDDYVKALYLGFDEIYVFTLPGRMNKKKNIFGKKFEKVKIIEIQ
jgi:hypothetical protein